MTDAIFTRYRLADMTAEQRRYVMQRSTADVFDPELNAGVARILEAVRDRGDAAVSEALRQFDGVDCPPEQLLVTEAEFAAARSQVSDDVLDGIRQGIANISAYNRHVLEHAAWQEEIAPGVMVGEQVSAVESAALFIPSGKGSFPSVVMHLGPPARIAGVETIVLVVPPKRGTRDVDPAVLVAADELGLHTVYRANGPAGIAAAAFGTESIPGVRLVVGPGSPAVTAAQVQVQAHGCSTVMLFGPTESVVVADRAIEPRFLAAYVLNEAEHGADSATVLVTSDEALIDEVEEHVREQLGRLPQWRSDFARAALSKYGGAVLTEDVAEAVAFADDYAAEHTLLALEKPEAWLPRLRNAGEILLGDTPFSVANYALGVPGILPTGGFAKVSSGVTARTFVKASSIGRVSPEALARLTPGVVALAEHEGFPAHAAAMTIHAGPSDSDGA